MQTEKIYRRRLPFKILFEHLYQYGLFYTSRKLIRYCKPKVFLNNYLDILGIFNGVYAYKGPFHVQIDLTNKCNNNCIGCWCNSPLLEEKEMDPATKRQTLPYNVVKELIDELYQLGIEEIYYSGGGEPFMHHDIIKILEYTKKKNITCHLHTNFTLLSKDIIKKIIDLKIDFITVSVWAGSAKIYRTIHPNKTEENFYKIKENLKFLNKLKKKAPYVKLYNVICRENYFEIDKMIGFALKTNSDAVEFTLIDTIPGKTEKLKLNSDQQKKIFKMCKKWDRKTDKNYYLNNKLCLFKFDQFLRRVSDSDNVSESKYDKGIIDRLPCYIGWLYARVLPDGNVNPCLKAHRFPTGNLYKNKFSDIWNGELQKKFRKKTLSYEKKDPFFKLIGNDPDTDECGCYKSCDDIQRNLHMHRRIMSLSIVEIGILRILSRLVIRRNFNKKNIK